MLRPVVSILGWTLLSVLILAGYLRQEQEPNPPKLLTLPNLYKLLGEDPDHLDGISIWIQINPQCRFCQLQLLELSAGNICHSLHLVSESSGETVEEWAEQFSWSSAPFIWEADRTTMMKTFGSSATPIVLVFNADTLIYKQRGFMSLKKLESAIDTQKSS